MGGSLSFFMSLRHNFCCLFNWSFEFCHAGLVFAQFYLDLEYAITRQELS